MEAQNPAGTGTVQASSGHLPLWQMEISSLLSQAKDSTVKGVVCAHLQAQFHSLYFPKKILSVWISHTLPVARAEF